ncbi:nuclease domain-containing protein [Mesorhizobium sp.]|uniref:nuclease domain-containing protein n=1 Tax=Mesorhizobium sp. TaxID=1871066 RepID=UPI000FE62789|nr:nuclease domain-containing protein [Mesorhizobium sp.]RWO22859.1 MAG: DUF1364 family protein [Mesorhizobium sp.]
MGIVSSKLRASAKGQPCTFQIPGICNHDSSTTVLAHLPSDVKGIGNKSDDFHAAFACSECHNYIDNHRLSKEDELYFSMRGLQRTLHIWVQSGLVFVPQDTHRPKPSSKIMDRRHIASGETIR